MDKSKYIIARADYIPHKTKHEIIKAIEYINQKKRARHYLNKAYNYIHKHSVINSHASGLGDEIAKTSLTKADVQKIVRHLWNKGILKSVDTKAVKFELTHQKMSLLNLLVVLELAWDENAIDDPFQNVYC